MAVAVAVVLLRGTRRWTGLLFVALALATAALLSPEPNLLQSPYSLPPIALYLVLGVAVAASGRPLSFVVIYAGAADTDRATAGSEA